MLGHLWRGSNIRNTPGNRDLVSFGFGMAKDNKTFCHVCLPCQRSKVHRHARAPLQDLPVPDHRFQALHLYLVGPLIPLRAHWRMAPQHPWRIGAQ